MYKAILTAAMLATALGLTAADWTFEAAGKPFWQGSTRELFDAKADRYQRALVFTAPGNTVAEPPAALTARTKATGAANTPAKLTFRYVDNYAKRANTGYFQAFVEVNGKTVWQQDVVEENDREFTVELESAAQYRIAVGVRMIKKVTNFAFRATFETIELASGGKAVSLLAPVATPSSFVELPDLPDLPALPPRNPEWFKNLTCVQGWFQSDYNLLKRREKYLPLMRDELKINTYLARPPAVFNAKHHNKTPEPGHITVKPADFFITDREFADAIADYRKNGFHIIMYTSITNLGHTAEWNGGDYQQRHPDQLQRGANGDPVRAFGNLNLCPNGAGLDYAIAYAKKLVADYQVDALMFDNNFFQSSSGGRPSCYCENCQRKFKAFVLETYGDKLELLGTSADKLAIPTAPGPLMMLWIDWRNRSWGEAMEQVRRSIEVPVFANTEYMWRNWQLGVDRVYRHEDAVFSESDSITDLPEKYALGNAFAPDRPHFAYLVSYLSGGKQFWRLRPPGEVAELVGTTMLFNVNLWLMAHGWDPELGYPEPVGETANLPSQDILKRYFQFRYGYRDWFRQMKPLADIAVVTPSRNRMDDNGMNYTEALSKLLRNGFAVEAVHDLTLAQADLGKYRFVVADKYELMSQAEAEKLLDFVKRGGVIYASPEAGRRDQFGRLRPDSILFAGYAAIKDQAKGRIELYDHAGQLPERLEKESDWKSKSYLTVIKPYTLPDGRTLLQVMDQNRKHQKRDLLLPKALRGLKTVTLHSPHLDQPIRRDVKDGVVYIPEEAWYFILECPKP